MEDLKSTILRHYMRNAYEEFASLLCEEIRRKNPSKHKMLSEIKEAVKRVMDAEFGKEAGLGDLD